MHTRVKTSPITAGLLAFVLGTGALILSGCADEPPQNISSAPPVLPPPPPPPAAEQPKERPVYVYSGDRFRDPFIPAGTTGSYQPDAVFDPSKATLHGVIFGPTSRTAVLSASGGGTYFVKAGKIFDIMGKTIDGFTAKVYKDRIVINGEADSVFELKIRNEEESSL